MQMTNVVNAYHKHGKNLSLRTFLDWYERYNLVHFLKVRNVIQMEKQHTLLS